MASRLRNKYVPRQYKSMMFLSWLDLRQGKMPVRDYIQAFEECRMRCRFVEDSRGHRMSQCPSSNLLIEIEELGSGSHEDDDPVGDDVYIVDEGLAEEYQVLQRARLSTISHPAPYDILWIDHILCDVLLMKIGGIILGRPWLFDYDVQFMGRANTCSFMYRDRQLVWYPHTNKPTSKRDPKSRIGLIMDPRCALLSLWICKMTRPLPPLLQKSRVCYWSMPTYSPEELPRELPPLRHIQHAIDLVPGASLPNLPHYRMEPTKYEELSRQVQELLDKGLIHEKLNDVRPRYSIYDCEFYVVIQALKHWHHYLLYKEFLSDRHARWVEYLQDFTFVLRHKKGKENVMVDTLRFESLSDSYADCPNFGHVLQALSDGPSLDHKDFLVVNGCLFFRSRLCILCTSLRDFLTWECHARGLFGHFGRDKTIAAVEYQFYWPTLKRNVGNVVTQCRVCALAKQVKKNARLYTPLSVPTCPWDDVSIDFVLGLPRTARRHDSIMVVVDRFSKMAHFYFREIARLHGLPKSIVLDRDVRFTNHFWRTLWSLLGTKLKFSTAYHPQTDGQTEVVNRSLGNLFRSLVGESLTTWDLIIPCADPFEITHGLAPHKPLDLVPLDPHVRHVSQLHQDIHDRIQSQNALYKQAADMHH
ncbi:unnamed protein product [Spirodela intermedia]|uniref:Integrase catalytic domain-containing protein n=1 Tax=Spirodela intermedia TaxID=51605 RepID=A0A7I8L376_SPIIN|nr:unnamed protein product [Spirodela intermedia]